MRSKRGEDALEGVCVVTGRFDTNDGVLAPKTSHKNVRVFNRDSPARVA